MISIDNCYKNIYLFIGDKELDIQIYEYKNWINNLILIDLHSVWMCLKIHFGIRVVLMSKN